MELTEVDIAERLRRAVDERARHHGVRLGAGADSDIAQFVKEAAKKVARDPSRMNEAERAFERLIDEMFAASTRIKDYQPGLVGERTLADALSRLCPMFPIC